MVADNLINVGYIGSGPISDFHIPALKNNGLNIGALGTTKNSESSKELCKKYGLNDKYCKGGWEEVLNYDLDAYIVCIKIEKTLKVKSGIGLIPTKNSTGINI